MNQINSPKRSRLLSLIAVFLIIFGSLFGLAGWYSLNLEQEYEAKGVTVKGSVIDKFVKEEWRTDSDTKRRTKTTTYYLKYRFEPRGAPAVEADDSVDSEVYKAAQSGNPLDIEYLSDNPNKNRIAGHKDFVAGYIFSGLGSLILLAGLLLFAIDFKKSRLHKRLMGEGMLVEAVITNLAPGNLRVNNVQQWKIYYSFRDIRGMEINGVSDNLPPRRVQDLKIGDKGKVKYDRDKSSTNIWIG